MFFIVLAEYLRAMQHLSDNQQRSVSSEANAAALYRQYQAAAGMSQPVMLRPGLQMPQEGNASSQGRSSHGSSNLQSPGSHGDRGQNHDHDHDHDRRQCGHFVGKMAASLSPFWLKGATGSTAPFFPSPPAGRLARPASEHVEKIK